MILSFPPPLPDELLISVLGRYYHLYVINNLDAFNREFFGYKSFSQSTILPCRINHFVNATKLVFPTTTNEVIQNFTQFPFYRNFVSDREALHLKRKMANNGIANSSSFIGLNSSKVIDSKHLMYCPDCLLEDINNYNQAYFHRVHQLLIPVCKIHNVKLHCYIPHVFDTNPQKPPILDDRVLLNSCSSQKNKNKLFNNILEIAIRLLEGSLQLNSHNTYYKEQLNKLGFYKGSVLNHEKINAYINSTIHQTDIIELLNLTKENDSIKTFYSSALYRPNKIINPLKHLFLYFLIEQMKSSITTTQVVKQKEACLNKLCDSFLILNQLEPIIKYDLKLKCEVQHFECSCGMSFKKYLKRQKDQTFVWKKKIIRYGDIWESSLLKLFKSKQSYYSIGKTLGVTHNVAKRMILKLLKKDKVGNLSNNYKALWRKALKENNYSIKETRARNARIYKWLFKNDQQWLVAENIKYKKVNNNGQLRINWGELDHQLNELIKKNYNQLIQCKYPKTISKSLLFRTAKSLRSITKTKEINRLPLTMQFIENVVENKAKFQQRKLTYAVDRIRSDSTSLNRSRILRTAKIRKLETTLEPELSRIIKKWNT
ncbi:MAG: TnsD family Tn7-like transposition protein [Cyclobacteriaceae bacterium]